jgi:probable blue pigment (indigoidine) exporter
MTSLQQAKNMGLTALAPMVWGSTYIVVTEMLPANSPLIASMIRALPAGILLALISQSRPKGLWWARLATLGLLNIGLFFFCLFYAATTLPGGVASMVMSFQPILVMALSWKLLNTNLTRPQLLASLIGITGIALLVLNNTAAINSTGFIVALIGTFSMAYGVVLTKKWGRPEGMSMLGFTGWQLLTGGLMLLPVSIYLEDLPSQLTVVNVIGYVYLSLAGAVIGYFLWFRGIEMLPPVTVSFLGFLSSVSACMLGYLILGQTLSFLQIMGALFILFSIISAAPRVTHKTKPVQ